MYSPRMDVAVEMSRLDGPEEREERKLRPLERMVNNPWKNHVWMFAIVVLVCLVLFVIGFMVITFDFVEVDHNKARFRVDRLKKVIWGDILDLRATISMLSIWDLTASVVEKLKTARAAANLKYVDISVLRDDPVVKEWFSNFYLENGEWNTELGFDFFVFYDENMKPLYGEYHPSFGVNKGKTLPLDSHFIEESHIAEVKNNAGLLNVPGGDMYIIAEEPIAATTDAISDAVGHFVIGRQAVTNLQTYADTIDACIGWFESKEQIPEKYCDKFDGLEAGGLNGTDSWTSDVRHEHYFHNSLTNVVCPSVVIHETDSSLTKADVFFFVVHDFIADHEDGPYVIVSRRCIHTVQSLGYTLITTMCYFVPLVLVFLCWILFLRFEILTPFRGVMERVRRVTRVETEKNEKLKMNISRERLARQARSNSRAMEREISMDNIEYSTTRVTYDSAEGSDGLFYAIDAFEDNNSILQRRLGFMMSAVKQEQLQGVRIRDALSLLNLWCGRTNFFPGLKLTETPAPAEDVPNNMDYFMQNPVPALFLKEECIRHGKFNNYCFLLDTYWMEEIYVKQNDFDDDLKTTFAPNFKTAFDHIIRLYLNKKSPYFITAKASLIQDVLVKRRDYDMLSLDYLRRTVKNDIVENVLRPFRETPAYRAMLRVIQVQESSRQTHAITLLNSIDTAIVHHDTDPDILTREDSFIPRYERFGGQTKPKTD